MESIPLRKKILETIVSKSTLKQKVFDNTFATFNDLKETLLEMASEMDDQLDGLLDRRVRFNRNADEGYLIGRIFINREKCYFVEGKQQTSMRPMQFGKAEIDSEALVRILESAIYYALNFDLLLPSYDDNKRVTVDQFNTKLDNSKFVTGKRLGYDFDVDDI